MIDHSINSTIVLLALLASFPAAIYAEQPLALGPREGLLLLKNGQVLQGKITPAGDHYLLTTGETEIRLKVADVEFCCRDLEEGYRRKSLAIVPGQAEPHLELADWCLRHGLLGYAAKEIGQALVDDPRHPKIPLLERRLKLARDQPAEGKASEEPIDLGPSNDDLDRLTRGLPAGAVEIFADKIQPLLIHNCATGGCHGPRGESKFSLSRVPLGKTPSRRLTQRNLYSAWHVIDHKDPLDSPLLTAPVKQHGTTKAPIFTSREMTQYRQLVAWVQIATRDVRTPQAASVDKPHTSLLQTMPSIDVPRATSSTIPKTVNPQRPDFPPLDSTNLNASSKSPTPTEAADANVKPRRTGLPVAYTPVDPFDPEIFNRRFFPEGSDASPKKESARDNHEGNRR